MCDPEIWLRYKDSVPFFLGFHQNVFFVGGHNCLLNMTNNVSNLTDFVATGICTLFIYFNRQNY